MINIIKTRLLSILFFVSSLVSQGPVDGVAAFIGKNILLRSEVLQQTQVEGVSLGVDPLKSPLRFEGLYSSVLSSMVDQYVLLDLAEKDTNIVVTQEEVGFALDQQIQDFILRAGSEKALEEATGMSIRRLKDEYWGEVYNMLMIDRYRFSLIQGLDVSRKQVLDFFENNKELLPLVPSQFSFSFVEIPFSIGSIADSLAYNSALRVFSLLSDGGFFDSLAILYSQDPGTSQGGGFLGFTKRGALVQEYEEVAFSLEVGEISLPVKSPFGYHIIKLLEKRGEKISTQHILKTIMPTPSDSSVALLFLDSLLSLGVTGFGVFDSMATTFSYHKKMRSGIYDFIVSTDIPVDIFLILEKTNPFSFSSIFFTSGGAGLLYKKNYDG